MQPKEQTVNQTDTATEPLTEKVVTSFEGGRLVARVFGHEDMIDGMSVAASEAKTAQTKWDEQKPILRSMARRVIDAIESKAIAVRAVLFQGSNLTAVEVAPSTITKTLSQDLINETKFRNAEHVIQENITVTLSGSLARWALVNLPVMCKPNILEENMKVSKKFILTEAFYDLYKHTIRDAEATKDHKDFFQRLFDGGYNLPAVEAKK